ncbi:MAG: polysaccharide biosynthesis protein [Pseudoxanthomonas sp.]
MNDALQTPGNSPRAKSSSDTVSPVANHLITRASSSHALTPSQLRDRSIIYRTDVARPEVNAFRDLRTKLLSVAEGNFITLVAPVSAGCGGSFVARNLAAAMAFDDTRSSLLVDCDLRHPSQDATMQIKATAGGLTDYLEDPEHDLATVLYDTGVPRVRLLPAGRQREIGAEYFSTFRMRVMLDSLRSRYSDRYLFLDSPPVIGSPDARILADLADVVVLVAGYGRDTPSTIAQAAANFDPNKFAGVIFNEGI